LKLLILAGTQLQETEFKTIRLCSNLINLDLSSNNLKGIPPCLAELKALKILFLHSNLLDSTESLNIKNCQAEYVTLFSNPIRNYRKYLISSLPRLKGIDLNMICGWEKAQTIKDEGKLPLYTEIKWPIVELEKGL
jgi:Leucine-rich repeat (LRR) protein